MREGFRQAMAWLHTWTGLVVGWVLYFIFVTGTVGYFYVAIDRWMRPELPLAGGWPSLADSAAAADAFLRREAADADYWWIELPAGRQSRALRVSWGTGRVLYRDNEQRRVFVPANGGFHEPA